MKVCNVCNKKIPLGKVCNHCKNNTGFKTDKISMGFGKVTWR